MVEAAREMKSPVKLGKSRGSGLVGHVTQIDPKEEGNWDQGGLSI